MCPSAKELYTNISDILVREKRDDIKITSPKRYCFYEVLQQDENNITVRELTSFGPIDGLSTAKLNDNMWYGVIRKENRTDISKVENS